MQEFRKRAKKCVPGRLFGFHLSRDTEPKKQNPATKERSFTELRFASFPRSIVRAPGRLSRVEMNSLRSPLTVSQELLERCANFSLDKADDFIEGLSEEA